MDPALEQEIKAKMTSCMKQGGGGGMQLSPEECTKNGGAWNGTQCDFSAKGAGALDATECTKQGGIWSGTQCDFSKQSTLDSTECAKQGGTWNGTSCDFATKGAGGALNAEECTKNGGSWDGTKCNFPAPPTSGDQSQVPQGYSSWQEFCKAQPDDSRCAAYKPQIDCSPFTQVPSCSYVGSSDSQNYKYCKQCYPNK